MNEILPLPEKNKRIRKILKRSKRIKDFDRVRDFKELYNDSVVGECINELVYSHGFSEDDKERLEIKLLHSILIYGNERRKVDRRDYYAIHLIEIGEFLGELYNDMQPVFKVYGHDNLEKRIKKLISGDKEKEEKLSDYNYIREAADSYRNEIIRIYDELECQIDIELIENDINITVDSTIKTKQYGHLKEVSDRLNQLKSKKGDLTDEEKEEFEKLTEYLIEWTIDKTGDSYHNQSTLFKDVNEENYIGLELKLRRLKVKLGERLSSSPGKMAELYKAAKSRKTRFNGDSLKYQVYLAANEAGNFLRKPKMLDDLDIIRTGYKAIKIIGQRRRDFGEYDSEEDTCVIKNREVKKIYDKYVDNQLRVVESLIDMRKRSRFYHSEYDDIKKMEEEIHDKYSEERFFGADIIATATIRFYKQLTEKKDVYSSDPKERFKEMYRDLLVQYYWVLGYKENKIKDINVIGSGLEEKTKNNIETRLSV
tara:strand:+ start:2643 stop:4088 length:1446 start_codon:yes stop_codon:yes gene_type:complete